MVRLILVAVAMGSLGCQFGSSDAGGPYRVPEGFVVEEVADPAEVGSLIQITFDAQGRPVVSKERDHPVRLVDSDGDGFFESQQVVSDEVENCQGIWFDGPTLYANCTNPDDGEAYLFRLADDDADGVADSREILVGYTGRIGEHGPHDIRRAPDGSITVLLGNHTFIPDERISDRSPLRNYGESQLLDRYMDARGHAAGRMAPGGALFRLEDQGAAFSMQFGGFRNPYNHAYNYEGEAFTFDSDMEWDLGLPWYREVRSVHATPSADFGWRTGSGKFPDYYVDSLPPVDDLGRGSPVGVDFYHSYAYPPEYFDAFLQGDWSRGRVVLSRLERAGATYQLAEPASDFIYGEPLNVTDLAVGPDGLVYFTIGGRMTQGGIFRVDYAGRRANSDRRPETGILSVVRQPQPLSAFSHAYFAAQKESMGPAWAEQLQGLVRDDGAESPDRIQALHLLQRYGPKPDAVLLRSAISTGDASLRAAAVYVVGQHGSDRAKTLAADALRDDDPFVRRRAAEALLRMGDPAFADTESLYGLLRDSDRFVRWSGRVALEATPRSGWSDLALRESDPMSAATGMLSLVRTASAQGELQEVVEKGVSMLGQEGLDAESELALLRAIHLGCIGLQAGCAQGVRDQLFETVAARFPSEDARLNREYAFTMAYSGRREAVGRILPLLGAEDETRAQQINYAYALREIKKGWTAEQKRELVDWFRVAKEWRGGASFAGFINLLFESSLDFFDESEREAAYAAIPEFAPVDDEGLLASLRGRGGHQRPNVFARKRGTGLYSNQEIFEYMMYDPMTTVASSEQGWEIFEDACSNCHRYGDAGEDYGPDLTTIANRFTRRDLLESILWPSRTISDQYASWRIETRDDVYSAMILEEDEDSITVLIPDLDRPVSIPRANIVDIRESDVSIMPEGLLDAYDMRQTAGLFRLLEEARGAEPGD